MKDDVTQKPWPGCACCTRKLFGHEIEMGMCPDCAAQFEIMPQLDGPDNPMTTNEQAGGEPAKQQLIDTAKAKGWICRTAYDRNPENAWQRGPNGRCVSESEMLAMLAESRKEGR